MSMVTKEDVNKYLDLDWSIRRRAYELIQEYKDAGLIYTTKSYVLDNMKIVSINVNEIIFEADYDVNDVVIDFVMPIEVLYSTMAKYEHMATLRKRLKFIKPPEKLDYKIPITNPDSFFVEELEKAKDKEQHVSE